jgi:peptide alpha-N-acetyltransferase
MEEVTFRTFEGEQDLQIIISLIEKELSEPYPIYTYRYFVQQWPEHTFLAFYKGECIGCIVSKLENNVK